MEDCSDVQRTPRSPPWEYILSEGEKEAGDLGKDKDFGGEIHQIFPLICYMTILGCWGVYEKGMRDISFLPLEGER